MQFPWSSHDPKTTTKHNTLTYSTVTSRNPDKKVPSPLSSTYPTSRTNCLNLEENLTSSPNTSAKTDISYLSPTSKLKTCMERSRYLRAEADAQIGQTYNDDNNTLMTSRSNESIALHASNLQTKINTTDSDDTMDDSDSKSWSSHPYFHMHKPIRTHHKLILVQ